MVKKNRHCAGRKKRERILCAQREAAKLVALAEPMKRIARVDSTKGTARSGNTSRT